MDCRQEAEDTRHALNYLRSTLHVLWRDGEVVLRRRATCLGLLRQKFIHVQKIGRWLLDS